MFEMHRVGVDVGGIHNLTPQFQGHSSRLRVAVGSRTAMAEATAPPWKTDMGQGAPSPSETRAGPPRDEEE